jgi:hypothetical protein
MARKNFQDILAADLKLKPKNELFFTPEEGKTAEVTFIWESLGDVTYPKARSFSFESRPPYDDNILEQVPDLDNVLKVKTYNELSNMFYQVDTESEGGELKDVKEDEPIRERKSIRDRGRDEEGHRQTRGSDDGERRTRNDPPVEKKEDDLAERRRRQPEEKDEDVKTERSRVSRRDVPEKTEEERSERRSSRDAASENAEKSAAIGKGLREAKRDSKAGDDKERCPHGHKFGVDTAEFKDCDSCTIYDDCDEELIKRKRAGAK